MLVSLAQPALASEEGYSATYTSCMDASGGVTVNVLDCTAAETALQDARLNSGYKAANKVLSSENKASLLTAQSLWLIPPGFLDTLQALEIAQSDPADWSSQMQISGQVSAIADLSLSNKFLSGI